MNRQKILDSFKLRTRRLDIFSFWYSLPNEKQEEFILLLNSYDILYGGTPKKQTTFTGLAGRYE